jgi:RecB family endonuclease NucS
VRLLILKADGSVLVHDDAGGYKPLNLMMTPQLPGGLTRRAVDTAVRVR